MRSEQHLVSLVVLFIIFLLSSVQADVFSDVLSTIGVGSSHAATNSAETKVDQAPSSTEPSIADYAKDMLGLKYKEPTEVPEGNFVYINTTL